MEPSFCGFASTPPHLQGEGEDGVVRRFFQDDVLFQRFGGDRIFHVCIGEEVRICNRVALYDGREIFVLRSVDAQLNQMLVQTKLQEFVRFFPEESVEVVLFIAEGVSGLIGGGDGGIDVLPLALGILVVDRIGGDFRLDAPVGELVELGVLRPLLRQLAHLLGRSLLFPDRSFLVGGNGAVFKGLFLALFAVRFKEAGKRVQKPLFILSGLNQKGADAENALCEGPGGGVGPGKGDCTLLQRLGGIQRGREKAGGQECDED
ncbi:hypothetical protein [Planifilum fimeticola]|uniref:hypothetical protein n=1 Tax=Planifilum fimeticola TaxID=201975 RepID=UPI0014758480|nr:hypothetical protein [Planifilum fimeticola]